MSIASDQQRVPRFTLGHRLALARESAGMDQATIAEIIGTSRATVSNYERGVSKPGKLIVNAWAVSTGVPVEWLKTGVEPSDNDPRGGNSQPSDYNAHVLELARRRRAGQATAEPNDAGSLRRAA
jgi:transcriptional regulator with XRE-family HTH domain